jgi:hypothetical protein
MLRIVLACSVRKQNQLTICYLNVLLLKTARDMVNRAIRVNVGTNYESIAKLWLCKKHDVTNMITAAVCWEIWKLRNSLCFQDVAWVNRRMVWWRVLVMLRSWRILVPLKMLDGFDAALSSLEMLVGAPEQIPWRPMSRNGVWPDGVDDGRRGTQLVQFDPP